MTEPLLTIAIPTFNRRELLEESLLKLLPQVSKLRDIELIVCDNASTDGTREMITQTYNGQICYYRNDENIGADGNFLKCLYNSKGKYILILSDDDVIVDGGLQLVMDMLMNDPDAVFLKSKGFEKSYDCNEFSLIGSKLQFSTYEDKEEYIKILGINATFVSSLIYKNKYVQNIANPEKYIGSHFLQTYIFFEAVSQSKGSNIIIENSIIAARGGNVGGYSFYTVWYEKYKELIKKGSEIVGYDDNITKEILIKSFRDSILTFTKMFRFQAHTLGMKNREKALNAVSDMPNLWIETVFWVYTPYFVLRFLKSIKNIIRR